MNSSSLEKTLPHSAEAERAVLGAVLLDNRIFDQAAELLVSEDFYLESHRRIFDTIVTLAGASKAVDILTLREELTRRTDLDAVGGVAYIASLVDGVPRVANIEDYARIVKEKAVLRKLVHSANDILNRSFSDEEDPGLLLEEAEKAIFQIGQERSRTGFAPLQELLSSAYKHVENLHSRQDEVTGVPTGFTQLDGMLSGLQNSDLIIIAARPGLGKTSLALNIAQYVAVKKQKVAGVFSLEMTSQQLALRLLCSEARVDSHKMRSGFLSKREWTDLAGAVSRLSEARLFIDDTPGISLLEMRSKARRLASEQGLDLLIVDYLQLMSGELSGRRRHENRQQEISTISRSLKALAKELSVPLIAISQLSRAPEQRRGNHRPQLSDLRESGSIEQDADVVMFIYRESYYKKDEDLDEDDRYTEIIVGKQRNGPTGTVKLVFLEKFTRFYTPETALSGSEPAGSEAAPF
ncbi:MAG: replicative DNA helicase [Acidobacteriota bacterium]|nr:replicative DNA helicase [Acidobacteriota bacterium]